MGKRTIAQNRSLHLYFTLLSDALNDSGYDMRRTLKPSISIPWSSSSVKEYLWKGIQEAMFNKESTTELTSAEIDKVYDVLNRHLGETTGVYVGFPSKEDING